MPPVADFGDSDTLARGSLPRAAVVREVAAAPLQMLPQPAEGQVLAPLPGRPLLPLPPLSLQEA